MATYRRRENFSLEEVLERLDAMEADPSIVYDSSESEMEDDEAVAVFPENSVGIEDNSGETLLYHNKNVSLRVKVKWIAVNM